VCELTALALEDLDRGRRFYARQRRSLGDYLLTTHMPPNTGDKDFDLIQVELETNPAAAK
jgi:hypothetical protein